MRSRNKEISLFLLILGLLAVPAFGNGVPVDVASLLDDPITGYGGTWTLTQHSIQIWEGALKVESQILSNQNGTIAFAYIVSPQIPGSLSWVWNLSGDYTGVYPDTLALLSDPADVGINVDFVGNLSVSINPFLDYGETLIFSFKTTTQGSSLFAGSAGVFSPSSGSSVVGGQALAPAPAAAVPEPSPLYLLLFGTGLLIGIETLKRKRFRLKF